MKKSNGWLKGRVKGVRILAQVPDPELLFCDRADEAGRPRREWYEAMTIGSPRKSDMFVSEGNKNKVMQALEDYKTEALRWILTPIPYPAIQWLKHYTLTASGKPQICKIGDVIFDGNGALAICGKNKRQCKAHLGRRRFVVQAVVTTAPAGSKKSVLAEAKPPSKKSEICILDKMPKYYEKTMDLKQVNGVLAQRCRGLLPWTCDVWVKV